MKWVTRVDTIRHILKLDLKLFVNHGSEISYCFLFIKYKVKKGSQEAEKTYEVEPQCATNPKHDHALVTFWGDSFRIVH